MTSPDANRVKEKKSCVIEEEDLQLHSEKLSSGCFCLLGFGLFAD